jgi:ABC-2 type transport system ATP-binding protein
MTAVRLAQSTAAPLVGTEPAIRVDGLVRDFGELRAVDHLTFEVPRGEIFGFLGPNGAGKTTTIRLLLGLLEPTAGRAEVLGYDPRFEGDAIRARAGALLEDSGLYDRLSGEDNLDFYGRVWHLAAVYRRARIRELLTRLGLWDRRRESPARWSTGMRQRLAIARTLLHRPALIFLDEPTSGLDPIAARELGDDLMRLAQDEGVTVFLTTHDLTEAERLCDRVAIVRDGRLLACGSPSELRARAGGHRAYIAGRGFDATVLALLQRQPEVRHVGLSGHLLEIELVEAGGLTPLITLLVRAGAEVEEARYASASLTDAFVHLLETRP